MRSMVADNQYGRLSTAGLFVFIDRQLSRALSTNRLMCLSGCRLSVCNACIVAKRYNLAENCVKTKIPICQYTYAVVPVGLFFFLEARTRLY